MLYLDLKRIMENKGIDKPLSFLVKAGFNYPAAHRILHQTPSSLNFVHLEKLCMALYCSIEDLLVWVPPKNLKGNEKHPLYKLSVKKPKGSVSAILKDLSPEKLEQAREYISKLNNGN
jgi:DNA-binding Xre family transcriptional regulator